MKFGDKTVKVLRNFSTISQSMLFTPGKTLMVLSPTKTILAKASVEDEITREFAIYDLPRFLAVLSMFDTPECTIGDAGMEITSSNKRAGYTFADTDMVTKPPKDGLNYGDPDIEFKLSNDQLSQVIKAAGVMSLPNIAFVGEDGSLFLRAIDAKKPTVDQYSIDIGATGKQFTAVFDLGNFKFMPNDYDVKLSSKGIAHFIADELEYWVAIDTNASAFE